MSHIIPTSSRLLLFGLTATSLFLLVFHLRVAGRTLEFDCLASTGCFAGFFTRGGVIFAVLKLSLLVDFYVGESRAQRNISKRYSSSQGCAERTAKLASGVHGGKHAR